jgi:flagellar biosynthetic protein FliR
MGLGIINVMDPLSQIQMPIIGQMLSLFGLLIFLLVGGHHLVIMALYKSFEIVPSLNLASFGPVAVGMLDIFSRVFTIAFMIGLPIIGVLFLATVAMGILSRAAPQMNIMMLGWPLNIFVGISTLIILIPMLYGAGQDIFEELFRQIDKILYSLSQVG